jgi:hypothetical protein
MSRQRQRASSEACRRVETASRLCEETARQSEDGHDIHQQAVKATKVVFVVDGRPGINEMKGRRIATLGRLKAELPTGHDRHKGRPPRVKSSRDSSWAGA